MPTTPTPDLRRLADQFVHFRIELNPNQEPQRGHGLDIAIGKDIQLCIGVESLSVRSTVWLAACDPGTMTRAGFPELDSKNTGTSMVLKLFPGPDGDKRRNNWVSNHYFLSEILDVGCDDPENVISIPKLIVFGTLSYKQDGKEMRVVAALMPFVEGERVHELARCPERASHVPLGDGAASSLRDLCNAMRRTRMTFGDTPGLSPHNVIAQYAKSPKAYRRAFAQGQSLGHRLLTGGLVLTNWSHIRRWTDDADQSIDFNATEKLASMIMGSMDQQGREQAGSVRIS
ncbi:hypothetical protein FA95DRAFT_1608353 [Auriscalpium vulgare]|uniref:Uncharacterized protein n=1 Tax=Auriscalpium vulgare TaxID=40419 RepID=A0ACB8RKM6_9AGAM|nr:hypothetical protein FA95DRAFT_1608353 [Auriscalpium vulgare]